MKCRITGCERGAMNPCVTELFCTIEFPEYRTSAMPFFLLALLPYLRKCHLADAIRVLGQSADGIANGPAWAALTKHWRRNTRTLANPAFAQGPEQGTAECDEPKQQFRANVRLMGTWACTDRWADRLEKMTATSHPAVALT